ncbi:MAG: tetratricopeptide repeat protein, partial [Plesiomonas shigelloides]
MARRGEKDRHSSPLLASFLSFADFQKYIGTPATINEGGIAGLESDPKRAGAWWRRCVDAHRHITATYELAVAFYTGDGIAENTELAVTLCRRAVHLGHAGAAYMLGECLLDGVGVERDRADALEWLVTAAELGHHLERVRVFTLLNENYQLFESLDDESERKYQEAEKWDYEMD